MYFVSGQQIQSNSYDVTNITIFCVGYERKVLLSGERKLENYDNRTCNEPFKSGRRFTL